MKTQKFTQLRAPPLKVHIHYSEEEESHLTGQMFGRHFLKDDQMDTISNGVKLLWLKFNNKCSLASKMPSLNRIMEVQQTDPS